MNLRMIYATVAVSLMAIMTGTAVGGHNELVVFTKEQYAALGSKTTKHNDTMKVIINKFEAVTGELVQEIVKDEGEDIPLAWRKDPKKIDKLIRETVSLTGDMLKEKTEFLLIARDVLTPEQKKTLIRDLEYRIDFFDNGSSFMFRMDDLSDILDLTEDQVKDILKFRTEMYIRELKMKLDIANEILDLKKMIRTGNHKDGSVDSSITVMAGIGVKLLNNRADYILTARKVLTRPQRFELGQLIMMNLEALIQKN